MNESFKYGGYVASVKTYSIILLCAQLNGSCDLTERTPVGRTLYWDRSRTVYCLL